MPKARDITGTTYGRLTVLARGEKNKHGGWTWLCRCACGNEVIVPTGSLSSGNSKSCGCFNLEVRRTAKTRLSHGMSKTPEHNAWLEMQRRCGEIGRDSYQYYGQRGIKVCERWKSFTNFYEDMGDRPSSAHSIERRDVNGDYTPENCYWATAREQGLNRRNNFVVTAFGQTAPLTYFIPSEGGKSTAYKRTWNRIRKLGWSPEQAISDALREMKGGSDGN